MRSKLLVYRGAPTIAWQAARDFEKRSNIAAWTVDAIVDERYLVERFLRQRFKTNSPTDEVVPYVVTNDDLIRMYQKFSLFR